MHTVRSIFQQSLSYIAPKPPAPPTVASGDYCVVVVKTFVHDVFQEDMLNSTSDRGVSLRIAHCYLKEVSLLVVE